MRLSCKQNEQGKNILKKGKTDTHNNNTENEMNAKTFEREIFACKSSIFFGCRYTHGHAIKIYYNAINEMNRYSIIE